eukprot:Rmarinus@m.23696
MTLLLQRANFHTRKALAQCRSFSLLQMSADDSPFVVVSKPVGPFQMNQYIVGCKETKEAAIVDCGDTNLSTWIDWASRNDYTIKHILQTHAHIDHVSGLSEVKSALPDAQIYLHKDDLELYHTATKQAVYLGLKINPDTVNAMPSLMSEGLVRMASMFGVFCNEPPPPDAHVSDKDVLEVGSLRLNVLHTPGHCPGHVCYYEAVHKVLFAGDLLFQGSIGRTDFPLSDPSAMARSLRRVMTLPDEVLVLPGHMAPTTIGIERESNPFITGVFPSV